jgi:anti-anti-sigma factor
MPLTIATKEPKPGLIEIGLGGRLDTETYPQLEKKLAELLAQPVRAVRFDLALLEYISSMGIRTLFKAFKTLKGMKAMFLVVNPQPQIKKVLEIAQALPPQAVFESVEEADAYYDAMQKKALGQGGDGL